MDALHCYFLSRPPCVRIGYFARLLPSLDVVAASQAPSPESNPYSVPSLLSLGPLLTRSVVCSHLRPSPPRRIRSSRPSGAAAGAWHLA